MQRLMVTGGAGFIGSNFVRYMLEKYSDCFIVAYDKLTYAGRLENLQDVAERFGGPLRLRPGRYLRWGCGRCGGGAVQRRYHRQLRCRNARGSLADGTGFLHPDRRLRHLRVA